MIVWRAWESLIDRHEYVFVISMAVMGFSLYPSPPMLLNVAFTAFTVSPAILIAKRAFSVSRWDVSKLNDYRFPSFHTGMAAALSFTVLYHHTIMGYLFVLMAACAGIARVTSGHHTKGEAFAGFWYGAFLSWPLHCIFMTIIDTGWAP